MGRHRRLSSSKSSVSVWSKLALWLVDSKGVRVFGRTFSSCSQNRKSFVWCPPVEHKYRVNENKHRWHLVNNVKNKHCSSDLIIWHHSNCGWVNNFSRAQILVPSEEKRSKPELGFSVRSFKFSSSFCSYTHWRNKSKARVSHTHACVPITSVERKIEEEKTKTITLSQATREYLLSFFLYPPMIACERSIKFAKNCVARPTTQIFTYGFCKRKLSAYIVNDSPTLTSHSSASSIIHFCHSNGFARPQTIQFHIYCGHVHKISAPQTEFAQNMNRRLHFCVWNSCARAHWFCNWVNKLAHAFSYIVDSSGSRVSESSLQAIVSKPTVEHNLGLFLSSSEWIMESVYGQKYFVAPTWRTREHEI